MTSLIQVKPRDTREGWPLLPVETEANGDSKSINERDPFLGVSLGSSCRYMRPLSCLGCCCQPSTKYFFLAIHYFNLCVLIAQQPGQAVVQGRLSLCVSGQTYIDEYVLYNYLLGQFICKVWWRYSTSFLVSFSTLVHYKFRLQMDLDALHYFCLM